jgi:hypothetical protein
MTISTMIPGSFRVIRYCAVCGGQQTSPNMTAHEVLCYARAPLKIPAEHLGPYIQARRDMRETVK